MKSLVEKLKNDLAEKEKKQKVAMNVDDDGDGDGDDDGDAYSDDHHGWSGHPGGGVGGVTALSRCQLCLEEMFGCAHFLCHDSTYDMKS